MAQGTHAGPVDKVPCPHCGQGNDFTEIVSDLKLAEEDSLVECDHCGRMMQVTSIVTMTTVSVVRSNQRPPHRDPEPTAATTVDHGALQRMLGRGRR